MNRTSLRLLSGLIAIQNECHQKMANARLLKHRCFYTHMHLGNMATKEKEIQVQGKVPVDARKHTMALHGGALSTSHPGRFTPGKSDDTS
jgi:hypothetical protein